jgi:hypothetical protein
VFGKGTRGDEVVGVDTPDQPGTASNSAGKRECGILRFQVSSRVEVGEKPGKLCREGVGFGRVGLPPEVIPGSFK